MKFTGLIIALSLLFLTGCVSPRKGATWYNPATWFKHAEAKAADKARELASAGAKAEDTARERLVDDAQKDIAAAVEALAKTPPAPSVSLASRLLARARDSLAVAFGNLPPPLLAQMRRMVADALSADAAQRKDGETALAIREVENAKFAQELVAARATLAQAEEKLRNKEAELRLAFDRENAVANQLRNERFLRWASVIGGTLISLIFAAGWAYVRFALGGTIPAIGRGMGALRARNPDAAAAVAPILDRFLNLRQQEQASRLAQSEYARELAEMAREAQPNFSHQNQTPCTPKPLS